MASSNIDFSANSPLRDHPPHQVLHDEVHAGACESLQTPARIAHRVQFSGLGSKAADQAHMADLCHRCDAPLPGKEYRSRRH